MPSLFLLAEGEAPGPSRSKAAAVTSPPSLRPPADIGKCPADAASRIYRNRLFRPNYFKLRGRALPARRPARLTGGKL
jgi:hypothetical protein